MAKKPREIDDMDGIDLVDILEEAEAYEIIGRPATQKQQEEFAHLLRFALDITGAPPRGYADDDIEAMAKTNDRYEHRKRAAKRKLDDIVRALREMADKYPALKEKYKKELDNLP